MHAKCRSRCTLAAEESEGKGKGYSRNGKL